nr:hypothetical protein [Tanacetum cinerariifolium]
RQAQRGVSHQARASGRRAAVFALSGVSGPGGGHGRNHRVQAATQRVCGPRASKPRANAAPSGVYERPRPGGGAHAGARRQATGPRQAIGGPVARAQQPRGRHQPVGR